MTRDGIEPFTAEAALALFSGYSHIVLVANSDAVDLPALRRDLPDTALFVFFNKVYKVLDAPFSASALLISRSGTMGANIVHRREAGDVLKYFSGERFRGVLNVRAADDERFSPAADFGRTDVRHLDLAPMVADVYPGGKLATSGFALALWLSELGLDAQVVLAGFSAKRSDKWKVFSVHDWTFEQIFLRLFSRLGKIRIVGDTEKSTYAALAKRFPEVSAVEIALTANEVLSERLDNANAEIDRLIATTRFIRSIDRFFRRLKPKTRKERFLAAADKAGKGDGPQ